METIPLTWDEQSMGFIPGRRREEAHLILRATLWYLTKLRLGWIACFWDVANAFPSLERPLLDGLASRIADPENGEIHQKQIQPLSEHCDFLVRSQRGDMCRTSIW
eukprot:11081274-Heterocapsa_arctica.AAC.1